MENKLTYLGIRKLPAVSTLSDANINRNSEVFSALYKKLYAYYSATLKPTLCHFTEQLDEAKIFCFDSSTITLFVDIFKGSGRNTLNGKKKGGLKLHTKMPMTGFVPDLAGRLHVRFLMFFLGICHSDRLLIFFAVWKIFYPHIDQLVRVPFWISQ
ncbi:MAG: hypothetical protein AAGA66_20620, partial [Bacteroidota bacterium]